MSKFEMPERKEWGEVEDPNFPDISEWTFASGERVNLVPEGDFFAGKFYTVEVEPVLDPKKDSYRVRIIDADHGVVISPEEDRFLWKRIWEEFKQMEKKKIAQRDSS